MRPLRLSRALSSVVTLAGVAVVAGLAIACTGGGGGLSGVSSVWDAPPTTGENAANSREHAPSSAESTPSSEEGASASSEPSEGAQGAGGAGSTSAFACAGTYSCVESGGNGNETLVLSLTSKGCGIVVGNTAIILAPDGSFLVNGQNAGTWSATADGFTATTPDGSVACSRGAQSSSSSGSSGKQGTSSSSGSVTIDAGTVQLPPSDAGS